MAWIERPGGLVHLGEASEWSYAGDGEEPRTVDLVPFAISAYAVSNRQWAEFATATNHRTESEQFGWSFVFAGLLPDEFEATRGVVGSEWWRQVHGADWAHPEGPHTDIETRMDHPVVHVSWRDAMAYCDWAAVRLPTEGEWEDAARAGTTTTWPWGDELEPGGEHRMNVFQGDFPSDNTASDGWVATCPVDAFAPQGAGVYNAIGNVWEWTADVFQAPGRVTDPNARVMKGGSYLCHRSNCRRFRPAARLSNTIDSAAGNVGFRVARRDRSGG